MYNRRTVENKSRQNKLAYLEHSTLVQSFWAVDDWGRAQWRVTAGRAGRKAVLISPLFVHGLSTASHNRHEGEEVSAESDWQST